MVGFFEPILRSHDREAFEIVCYAEVASPDETTHRLKSMADDWRVTCGRNADDVRTLIEADGIDILVDLAGHTANNRLDVFARAAAPVQVSMLGYLNTTGLTTMDYYVTDQVRDPPHDDGYYTEAVVRLPGGGCCWDPPARATAVMPPPSLRNGYVTYGSMHRPNKFTDQTIRLWSRILDRTAGSRLLIFHNSLGGSPELQGHLLRRFEAAGLAKERIDIAWDPSGEYLNAYDAMDILLEAVPWSSGTTALESLWMGVPIPTICGDRPVGRATVSALHRLHLDDLIAANEADYIEIVVGLANDAARRQTLRAELRDRMQSTICNADQFVQQLEAAYRTMCKEAQHAA